MKVLDSSRPAGREGAVEKPLPWVVRAAHREPLAATPVWFMRQAGRSLPEYRAIRERYDILAICQSSELCLEVTLQPVRRLGVDAAVLFADIMLPVMFGLGVGVRLVENVGPVVDVPIREAADLRRLRALPAEEAVPFVLETIRLLRRALEPERAVIGFAGAPFTLAGYLIEGRPSRDFLITKGLMRGSPDLWRGLMDRLTAMAIDYLRAQAGAGADIVQLFDSWVGCLSPHDYQAHVYPYTERIFDALRADGIPAIHFGTGTAGILPAMVAAGGDVIGLDWRVDLVQTWEQVIGPMRGVQGNLDPAVLLSPFAVVEQEARRILDGVNHRPGHIFNLGHGVLPETPVEHLQRLVELVHGT
ncbi:MAG: uroporphyrinogen decarboxylase [Chloroflexi bacterium]|nr:MAG: uroporphyrinogen decarboxylase [Chloroflexota bacterium]